jgi:hypothetical protein
LALLDDLKLGVAFERKTATFKKIEKFLLPNRLVVDEVLLFVCLAVVSLAHNQVIGLNWNPPLRIIKDDLNKVYLWIFLSLRLPITTSSSIICILCPLMKHSPPLLFADRFELVAERKNHR